MFEPWVSADVVPDGLVQLAAGIVDDLSDADTPWKLRGAHAPGQSRGC